MANNAEGGHWMRRLPWLVLTALLLLPGAGRAQSGCNSVAAQLVGPVVAVCVNRTSLYTFKMQREGDVSSLALGTQSLGDGASFSVSARLDSDPFAHFQFTSELPSGFGPISYDAWFTTGVVPAAYGAASSFGVVRVSATGGFFGEPGAGGVASQGTYPVYISGSTNLGSLGVDLGSGFCQSAVSPNPSTQQCSYGSTYTEFGTIHPSWLTARLSYTHATQGTGSSIVSWSGGVDLYTTTVPEPRTLWTVFAGMLVIMGVRTKRRRVREKFSSQQ